MSGDLLGGEGSTEIERVELEEFARGHIGPTDAATKPRPAATIVPVRGIRGGLEVLLLRRPDSARFAAGAYAFPGGTIDEADEDPGLERVLGDWPEWRALAAGLRELFEETGLLLADQRPIRELRDELRQELLANRISFHELVKRLDLTFRRIRVIYFARWITPERLARRYDARFFLAETPEMVAPLLTEEHTAYLWTVPGQALARFHAGELPMLFPTWKTLEQLARYSGMEEAVADLSGREVKPIQARLIVEGGKVKPVMPGDARYEEGR